MKRVQVLTMLFSGELLDSPQKRFDANYITAHEIQEYMGVSRVAALKRLAKFPYIEVGTMRLWERTPAIEQELWIWAMRRIRNGDMEANDEQLVRLAHERNMFAKEGSAK